MSADRFLAGIFDGLMGALLGLGGSVVRAPGLALARTHDAVLRRTLAGVVVVVAAWMCRARIVPLDVLATHLDVVASLLAGSLAGAWFSARRDWRAIVAALALALVAQIWSGTAGVLAGAVIGLVMGCDVAAGLLLVPAIVVLYGLDCAVAGSLALMVSMPLLLAGLWRFPLAGTLAILRSDGQFAAQAYGAMLGAALGTVLLGLLPAKVLMALLEGVLVYAAFINFGACSARLLHLKSAPRQRPDTLPPLRGKK